MNSTNKHPKKVVNYVLPKQITHGLLDTSEIAVPESESQDISLERQQKLRDSFEEQSTNLVPLIVRPTKAYGEEVGYEVIYGADWCLVAKKLKIEKLWVWVFEMTDQQATLAKEEMEQLVGLTAKIPLGETEQTTNLVQQLENSFQSKIDTLTKKIEQSAKKNEELLIQVKALRQPNYDESEQVKSILEQLDSSFQSKLKSLSDRVEQVFEIVKSVEETVGQQIKSPKVEVIPEKIEPNDNEKLNLLTADRRKLIDAVKNQKQAPAAWNAIQHLTAQGRLTWKNLEKLAKVKSGQDKIKGFGAGIYKKLQQIGYIPN